MKVRLRITDRLFRLILQDLERPHPFAFERVGFLACRAGQLKGKGVVLLASEYLPVADADYLDDSRYGALIGSAAIRSALEYAYKNPVGIFHVHKHLGYGTPAFSRVDKTEMRSLMPDFFNVRPEFPHGAILLSDDGATGLCWPMRGRAPLPISQFTIVGAPVRILGERHD